MCVECDCIRHGFTPQPSSLETKGQQVDESDEQMSCGRITDEQFWRNYFYRVRNLEDTNTSFDLLECMLCGASSKAEG